MPLVRIDLVKGKSPSYRQAVAAAVYDALVEIMNVPANDRFQVVAEHAPEDFVCDPAYLGIRRTPDCVFIQVTLNAGRTVEVKKAFYARLAAELERRVGLARADVFVSLVEVAKENWSFGNGEAQYAA